MGLLLLFNTLLSYFISFLTLPALLLIFEPDEKTPPCSRRSGLHRFQPPASDDAPRDPEICEDSNSRSHERNYSSDLERAAQYLELELSPAVAEAPPGVLVDFSQPGLDLDLFCQGIDESAVI